MKVLLDTHMLIWAFENNPLLPEEAKEVILNEKNEIYYSSISTWEIAIKHAIHPDEIELDENLFIDLCHQSGFNEIALNSNHVQSLSSLKPTSETNHKDPFDRMLMAQSLSEEMLFLTKDNKLDAYKLPNVIVYK